MVHIFEGLEQRKTAVLALSNALLPCTLWSQGTDGNRVLSGHPAVLCLPALSAQQWPLQPRCFFSLSFSACAINFSLSISFVGLDSEITVAVSTDGLIQSFQPFPLKIGPVCRKLSVKVSNECLLVFLEEGLVFVFAKP